MKLSDIHIHNFGHFKERRINLEADLLFIYGANEAGKTTLTHFLRYLLLGMPAETSYRYYLGGRQRGGKAQAKLKDGRSLEICSIRGRQWAAPTLKSEDGQTSAGVLNDNLKASVYAEFFTSSLEEFQSTAETLRSTDFKSFLSKVGTSGLDPRTLLQEFSAASDSFFRSPRTRDTLKREVLSLQELDTELKSRLLKPQKYYQLEDAYKHWEQRSQCLAEEKSALEKKLHAYTLLKRQKSLKTERDKILAELRQIGPPEFFPAGGNERLRQYENLQATYKNKREALELESKSLEKKLLTLGKSSWQTHLPDLEAALAKSEVWAVKEQRLQVLQNSQKLFQNRVSEFCQTQGFPWDELFLTRGQGQELESLHAELVSLQANLTAEISEEARLSREVSSLNIPNEYSPLLGDFGQDLFGELMALHTAETEQTAIIANLTGGLDLDLVRSRSWPSREEITAQEQLLLEQEALLQTLAENKASKELDLAALKGSLTQLKSGDVVQASAALRSSREIRDQLWGQLIVGRVGFEEFQQALRDSDLCADRLLTLAKEAGDLLRAEQEASALSSELDLLAKQEFEAKQRLRALRRLWFRFWQPLPRDLCSRVQAQELGERLRTLEGALKRADNLAEERAQLQVQVAQLAQPLGQLLGLELDTVPSLGIAFKRLDEVQPGLRQAEVERRLKQQNLSDLKVKLAEQGLRVASSKLSLQTREETWTYPISWKAWPVFKRDFREIMVLHEKCQSESAELESLSLEIRAARERLDRLAQLCLGGCGEGLAAQAAALAVELKREQARSKQEVVLSGRLERVLGELAKLRVEEERLGRECNQLLALCPGTSSQEFFLLGEKKLLAAPLEGRLLECEIKLEALAQELESLEVLVPQDLEESDAGCQQSLAKVSLAEKEALQNLGRCRQEFLQFQGGEESTSELRRQIACKQEKIKAGVGEFLSVKFAETLLQQAMQRYEEDSHPLLLRHISRVFAHISGGRYVEVEELEEGAYGVRRQDGRQLGIAALSSGTLEQLYLAIRIAAMYIHAQRAEPLPFIMDDILGNTDSERCVLALEALQELSLQTQVIFTTCHPELIACAKQNLPEGSFRVVEL